MSNPIADGDIWSGTAVVHLMEQIALPTFYFKVENTVAPGINDLEWATAFATAITTPLLAALTTKADLIGVYVQRHNPGDITPRAADKSTAGIGTNGSTALPHQTCGLTTWYTAKTGRSQRGRTYWPFPATAMQTSDGVPAGGTQALYIAIGTALLGISPVIGFAGQCDMKMGVFHRGTHTIDAITNQLVSAKWATQKRRGMFGRPNVSPI